MQDFLNFLNAPYPSFKNCQDCSHVVSPVFFIIGVVYLHPMTQIQLKNLDLKRDSAENPAPYDPHSTERCSLEAAARPRTAARPWHLSAQHIWEDFLNMGGPGNGLRKPSEGFLLLAESP